MAGTGSRDKGRRDVNRLVYGYAGGLRHGQRRTALAISTARLIDGALGRCGLAHPAVLVSGFWRSGTTWLQESLAATLGGKTVFEPLSPLEPHRHTVMLRHDPDDSEDLRQATIPGPQGQHSDFWTSMDRACTGVHASPYLLSCRQGVGESLRRKVVVKDVRLQANLAAFHDRYHTPVVHIRRHPCAVVASLVAADWHWSLARVKLADLLPRLAHALSEADRAVALSFDTDAISRIAAFWAVTERIAAEALRGQTWGAVLNYERFALDPADGLARICERLAITPRYRVDVAAPSASVDPNVFASYETSPSERWRRHLPQGEIDKIEGAADTIFPRWRTEANGG